MAVVAVMPPFAASPLIHGPWPETCVSARMTSDTPARYLNDASALLGLPIRPEHREAVEAAFAVLLAQGQLVTRFALPEETEAAPRYVP